MSPPWNASYWRVAERLQATYLASTPEWSLPAEAWQDAIQRMHRLELAHRHGWQRAVAVETERAQDDLQRLIGGISRLQSDLVSFSRQRRPSTSALYQELCAVAEEFGDLDMEDGELFVTTDPITLEDVDLGRFQIRFKYRRFDHHSPIRVVALEPNPARSDSSTTHPHIANERVCMGEGKAAFVAALADGRISDCFLIVDRILHHYAEGSAYCELSRWFGVPCSDCNTSVDDDDVYHCQGCEDPLCCDCLSNCANCSDSFCATCVERCAQCEESICRSCLGSCAGCSRDVCPTCLEEGLCEACREQLEDSNAEDETNDDPALEADATLHADGVGEARSSS